MYSEWHIVPLTQKTIELLNSGGIFNHRQMSPVCQARIPRLAKEHLGTESLVAVAVIGVEAVVGFRARWVAVVARH